MSILFINKKGITIVETLIAAFLTAIAVISLTPMFPLSMQTSAKSDYTGRAVGILQRELEFHEELVMKGVYPPTNTYTYPDQEVTVSQLASKEGDATFVVKVKYTKQGNNSWLVNVQVTWAGNSTGIKNSILATPQINF